MAVTIRGFSLKQMNQAIKEVKAYPPNQLFRLLREVLFHRFCFFSGFNRDPFRQELAVRLIDHFNIETFIETGTYRGSTTGYVAERFRNLKVISFEINEEYLRQASERLEGLMNVNIVHSSSETGIQELLREESVGNRLFFYLDAHWYDEWPLEEELAAISRSHCPAIIMIDDFKVPGRDDFAYDVYKGGTTPTSGGEVTDGKRCDWDLVKSLLSSTNDYRIFYPGYSSIDMFGRASNKSLRGYVTILQNMDRIEDFISGRFAQKMLWEFAGD